MANNITNHNDMNHTFELQVQSFVTVRQNENNVSPKNKYGIL
jgi:hypothetical protein